MRTEIRASRLGTLVVREGRGSLRYAARSCASGLESLDSRVIFRLAGMALYRELERCYFIPIPATRFDEQF